MDEELLFDGADGGNTAGDRYELYERLLLERDRLEKETGQIWTVYMQIFGQLITENYEEKVECIKCKKTIAYYQSILNRGGQIDAGEMKEYIDREMAVYYAELRRKISEKESAEKAGRLSAYEVKRTKELYRRLAKLIHPDLNPATGTSPELQELWQRVLDAYHRSNVKELSELEVLIRKTLKDLGLDDVRPEIPDLDERIDAVNAEIADITGTEPYTLRSLIEDDDAVRQKKDEIVKETEDYKKYHKQLNEVIVKLLAGGGLQIYVEGNN